MFGIFGLFALLLLTGCNIEDKCELADSNGLCLQYKNECGAFDYKFDMDKCHNWRVAEMCFENCAEFNLSSYEMIQFCDDWNIITRTCEHNESIYELDCTNHTEEFITC